MQIDVEDRPAKFQMLKIGAPDSTSIETISPEQFTGNWDAELFQTQAVGDDWLRKGQSCFLDVPSVLVPETRNVIVNPLHPEAVHLAILQVYQHAFDIRL